MTQNPPIINKATMSEQVFEYLRRAIQSDKLRSGERLKEAALARQLAVSRTPVREAIRMLEVKGLVTRQANGYTVVASRSLEDMVEAFHARIALETYAARLATQKATPEQIDILEAQSMAYEQNLERVGEEELSDLGNDFHATLIEMAGNRRIKNYIADINEYIYMYRLRLYQSSQVLQHQGASHHDILEAVKASDADAAQELMRQHLTLALEFLGSLWRS